MSSSSVKRFARMAACCRIPSLMSVVGLPHTSRRSRMERIQPYESSIDSASSVTIGTTPLSSGMPKSCIGTAARSEMSIVSTSSVGSSSPIWRLPISRRPSMMMKYKRIVRTKAVTMAEPPVRIFRLILPRAGTFYCLPPSYPDGGDRFHFQSTDKERSFRLKTDKAP